jgi:hypothetical protein
MQSGEAPTARREAHGGIANVTAVGDNRRMESLYRRHRFPPEIISHAVWL